MKLKFLFLTLAFLILQACGEDVNSAAEQEPSEKPISTGTEILGIEVCDEEYSMCGHLNLPNSLEGTPRELLIALFSKLPPQGPPDAVLMRVGTPSLNAGERYPLRVHPVLESGQYFLYVSLYMEGGGQYQPMVGIDYIGTSAEKLNFSGGALKFEEIEMIVAQ